MSVGGRLDGKHHARKFTGGEAIAKQLDELAEHGGRQGVAARLRALVKSERGYQLLGDSGINATRTQLENWMSEAVKPNPANARHINSAYTRWRRANMGRELKERLGRGGQGTQVEVSPVDQSQVPEQHRRNLTDRKVRIRPAQWDALIDAWEAGDIDGMDAIWEDIAEGADWTDYQAYLWVSSISFGA